MFLGISPGGRSRSKQPPGRIGAAPLNNPLTFGAAVWGRILCGQPKWKILAGGFPGTVILTSIRFPVRVIRELDANATLDEKARWKLVDDLYAEYDHLCIAEFARLTVWSVQEQFEKWAPKRGFREPWRYYQWFRPFYFQAGIDDPAAFLNKHLIDEADTAKFLGKSIKWGIHKDFARKLAEAAGYLDENAKQEVNDQIGHLWCFRPTTLKANKRKPERLSNHALGRAVDIDAPMNPHLKDPAIDEVLTWLQAKGLAGPERIKDSLLDPSVAEEARVEVAAQKVAAISKSIQAFLKEWLGKWERANARKDTADLETNKEVYEQVAKLVKGLGGAKKARQALQTGIISLPSVLFKAMNRAGIKSGIEYEESKDTMHFEILGFPAVKAARSLR